MASANISKKRKVRIHSDCQLESTDESEVWKDEEIRRMARRKQEENRKKQRKIKKEKQSTSLLFLEDQI